MWTNIKKSLTAQIQFLLVLCLVAVASLWGVFVSWQKHMQNQHNITRYYNISATLQPVLMQNYTLDEEALQANNLKTYKQPLPQNASPVYAQGNKNRGFHVYAFNGQKILHVFNPIRELYLLDMQKDDTMHLIHLIFLSLSAVLIVLFYAVKKLLQPINDVGKKLQTLPDGDFSKLRVDSDYNEVAKIENAYNTAIEHIQYLLHTREMFNKIFMHELKTPLAEGKFYLHMPPSNESHRGIKNVFDSVNEELDRFRTLEELISYKGEISGTSHRFFDLMKEVIASYFSDKKDAIRLKNCEDFSLRGDKQLWMIGLKNLTANALEYASDHTLTITCDGTKITFANRGDPLPLDLSKKITDWKLDRLQKHTSASGYGFGLFIIKNVITLNGYNVLYRYQDNTVLLQIYT
ncbi:MAG: ATP-binding protein [Campylobacterota bacterium]